MDKPHQTGTAAAAGRCCLSEIDVGLSSDWVILSSAEQVGCLAG